MMWTGINIFVGVDWYSYKFKPLSHSPPTQICSAPAFSLVLVLVVLDRRIPNIIIFIAIIHLKMQTHLKVPESPPSEPQPLPKHQLTAGQIQEKIQETTWHLR